jgi:predicted outer membrane repeat protein
MMKKIICMALSVLSICFAANAQSKQPLWSDVPSTEAAVVATQGQILPDVYQKKSLDYNVLNKLLKNAPIENIGASNAGIELELPTTNGLLEKFMVVESPILSGLAAAQNPDIKTYSGYSITNPVIKTRFAVTRLGLSAIILGDETSYIEAVYSNKNLCMIYSAKDNNTQNVDCNVTETHKDSHNSSAESNSCVVNGAIFRVYDMVAAATGEFTTQRGSPANAQAYITTIINNMNAIYEKEAATRIVVVQFLTYTDGATDPFDPFDPNGRSINAHTGITANATAGLSYDLGHVFHYGTNSGVAGIGVVCNNSFKARGWSAYQSLGAARYTDIVAHEVAHMFDAAHSYYGNESSCLNRSAGDGYEPGSGTTIMSYSGTCGAQNISGFDVDNYFHTHNLQQMVSFMNSSATCSANTPTGNAVPVANANPSAGVYTIPKGTPFSLTGSATDANNATATTNTLTYNWEEYDTDGGTGAAPNDAANSATQPLFRSFFPNSSPVRTFPQLLDLLNNTQTIGEILPQVNRTSKYRFTVRDNNSGTLGGAIACDEITINVNASAGPFLVTAPNNTTAWSADGTNTTNITWDVAGTTNAPINCANVDILLSVDGGLTYPHTLATNTPNDGTHNIIVPNYPTNTARIKIVCSSNIFFDISNLNFPITSTCVAKGTNFLPSTTFSAPVSDPSLDLALAPNYGSVLSIAGTLETTDPASNLTYMNTTTNACSGPSNSNVYDAYTFQVNTSGSYTFTTTGAFGIVLNLYTNSFNPSSVCTNFLASSATTGVIIGSSVTANLLAGVPYVLAVTSFSSTLPTLPSSYSIGVSIGVAPAAGNIYTGTPPPPSGHNYTYIAVNSAGNIIAIDASSNFTSLAAGVYTVYGLSYNNTSSLPSVGSSFSTFKNTTIPNATGGFCGNLSSNSMSLRIGQNPLPVSMLAFTGKQQSTNVQLLWQTADELNSSYFAVEKSTNGAEFMPIDRIQAAGNSNDIRKYTALDSRPALGKNYYRLKQVDTDGKYEYSNTIVINYLGEREILILPNPNNGAFDIKFANIYAEKSIIKVYDAVGKQVYETTADAAATTLTANLTYLPQGTYQVQILQGKRVFNTKFVKID